MPTPAAAAHARQALANKSPDDQVAIKEKIGEGVRRAARRRRAEARAVRLIKEAVPELEGFRAIIVILEAADGDE